MQRKLLFGLTLFCALGSMYAGVFAWGRQIQYGLLVLCVVLVVLALRSPQGDEIRPPADARDAAAKPPTENR